MNWHNAVSVTAQTVAGLAVLIVLGALFAGPDIIYNRTAKPVGRLLFALAVTVLIGLAAVFVAAGTTP